MALGPQLGLRPRKESQGIVDGSAFGLAILNRQKAQSLASLRVVGVSHVSYGHQRAFLGLLGQLYLEQILCKVFFLIFFVRHNYLEGSDLNSRKKKDFATLLWPNGRMTCLPKF